jgi:hypothetical protein
MLRIIWPGPLPKNNLARLFYPSIDRLLELIENKSAHKNSNRTAIADEFSRILYHIRIKRFNKTTNRNRLVEGDRLLASYIDKNQDGLVKFLDVGASDGITTLDTVNYFTSKLGLKIIAYALDPYLFLLRREKLIVVEYVTTNGHPVLVRIGPIGLVLTPWERPRGFLSSMEIWLTKWIVSGYLKLANFRSKMRLTAKIRLVNPEVIKAGNIVLVEMDIFEINPAMLESMDMIRASNIITFAYFSESSIKKALKVFHRYLHPGGLLLISRNISIGDKEVECGSLWKKMGVTFTHIADLSFKSEIKDIVDQFRSD